MMKPEEEKKKLLDTIQKLLLREYITQDTETTAALNALEDDINKDFFTIVVLGEFKRGKSTFVNALIGEDLLPADVLPTTATINALMYEDTRCVDVVMQDGTVRKGKATKEYLSQFSANNEEEAAQVKFVQIGCQAPILKHKVVIVDTPGVSDINEQRVQVTYDFIPKANAVVFLLDATAPLKLSEKEFIEHHLLSIGLDNIVFIANKYDDIDEEEDEDVIGDTKARMYKAFHGKLGSRNANDIRILPLSAKMALQGVLQQNESLIKASGIATVQETLQTILEDGAVTRGKLERYAVRLKTILQQRITSLQNDIALQQVDKAELEEAMERLRHVMNSYDVHKSAVDAYTEEQQKTIIAMTDKSLLTFHQKVKDSIADQVEAYNGADFKDFVETRITKLLKRNMEEWVEAYSPRIDELLVQLEQNLSWGMSNYFKSEINLHSGFQTGATSTHRFSFQFDVKDVSTATIQAGALTAGGAGLLMLVGGPVMMPFVGFLAYPFLQKKFLQDKLRDAKEQLKPLLNDQLVKSMCVLQNEVHNAIIERVECIKDNTNKAYVSLADKLKFQLTEAIQDKQKQNTEVEFKINVITKQIDELQSIVNSL